VLEGALPQARYFRTSEGDEIEVSWRSRPSTDCVSPDAQRQVKISEVLRRVSGSSTRK
jgi:hypothetical protein